MNSLGVPPSNFVKSTTTFANSALKATNAMTDMFVDSTSTVANSAMKALNMGVNSISNAVNSTVHSAVNSTTTAFKNVPVINSLLAVGNSHTNTSNSSTSSTSSTSTLGANTSKSSMGSIFVFLFLVVFFLIILVVFKTQIKTGIDNIISSLRKMFGAKDNEVKPPPAPIVPVPSASDNAIQNTIASKSIVNKIFSPSKHSEVFNVSTNEYTYYDAEPLCRALGAELATYSQVKDAWDKGADWCNYGWVKGQAAVYPTQKETWDKLQHGPEDEKYACGNPGVNGGYFDNPEMRFGVNCYGKKPAESSNDEKHIMAHGGPPKTPATLKVDQQIQQYKESIDQIGVLPFSDGKWDE